MIDVTTYAEGGVDAVIIHVPAHEHTVRDEIDTDVVPHFRKIANHCQTKP